MSLQDRKMIVLGPMEVCNEPLSLLLEFAPPKGLQAPSPVSLTSSAGQKWLRDRNAAGRHERMKADHSPAITRDYLSVLLKQV